MKTMKKTLSTTLLLALICFVTSCKDNFQLRVKNEYPTVLNNMTVGPANYGNISSGETSSYKEVSKGENSVSAYNPNGDHLTGSVSLSGRGKHKFTLTVTSAGGVTIKEDK